MTDADLVQNSAEWLYARCGSVGASDVPDIVRTTKTGPSATRANKLALKVLERLTGAPVETFQSAAMAQGHERQPRAIAAYEFMHDVRVDPVGLARHPLIIGSHASPDGIIGSLGLVEVKCPQPAAHLDTLLRETVERDYQIQIAWQLACTGRQFCDYISWNPDFPPAMQLWVGRVERNAMLIDELEAEVRLFLAELEARVEALKRRYEIVEEAA